ncbi:MAG TPA: hypothetical protein VHB79_11690 [Polyangiaceae bacterium]|nr:hypothetical protein [Polyangiaceae bacterium]
MKTGFGMVLGVAVCLLSACGGSPSTSQSEPSGSEIQLNLSTTGSSGTEYRLGPATFDIFNDYGPDPIQTLTTEGAEQALHIPLAKGYYNVKLRPGWTLARINGETRTPIAATLTSRDSQDVYVQDFETVRVNYAFHLGESGIDIGVTVDEGIPDGYDARLVPSSPGSSQYSLEWRGGGGDCCFTSLADAQARYPYAHIYAP